MKFHFSTQDIWKYWNRTTEKSSVISASQRQNNRGIHMHCSAPSIYSDGITVQTTVRDQGLNYGMKHGVKYWIKSPAITTGSLESRLSPTGLKKNAEFVFLPGMPPSREALHSCRTGWRPKLPCRSCRKKKKSEVTQKKKVRYQRWRRELWIYPYCRCVRTTAINIPPHRNKQTIGRSSLIRTASAARCIYPTRARHADTQPIS